MTRDRRVAIAVLLAVGLLVPAGCMSLPEAGPVSGLAAQTQSIDRSKSYDIVPLPPQQGESATESVQGFLNAMRAWPADTSIARKFLASSLRTSWKPEDETVTYGSASPPRETGAKASDSSSGQIAVTLSAADRLDGRGQWRGPLTVAQRTLGFHLVRERGEWRIDKAPDALVVPDTWFAQRYAQLSLYFFDPTDTILVPEPVFVPQGPQLATSLVRGLLRGPDPQRAGSLANFLPAGASAGLSVPVSDGRANVVLTGGDGGAPIDVDRMTAQLVWTLRQVPGLEEVGVGVGGRKLQLPGGRQTVDVKGGVAYDPVGTTTTDRLFGLHKGLLVSGATPTSLEPVLGPFGLTAHRFGSVSVDLTGGRAVGVTVDHTALWLAPLAATQTVRGKTVPARPRILLRGATDLLRPAWDFAGRLWLVDRTAHGARISVTSGASPRRLVVPGISGHDVRGFLVSHDGSRLVAVLQQDGGQRVVISRILHDPSNGNVVGFTRPLDVASSDVDDPIQDLGWSSPTTLLLLGRQGDTARVRTVSVTGAPVDSDGLSVTVSGLGARLVSSPSPDDVNYALTSDGVLAKLTAPEATPVQAVGGLADLWYAG